MIHLIDTKGLSWVLEEKNKIKSIMHIDILLLNHELNRNKDLDIQYIKFYEENKRSKNNEIRVSL